MGPNVLRCQADILGTKRNNYAQPPTSGMCLLPSISIIGRSCHNYNFCVCCDKSTLVVTKKKKKKKKKKKRCLSQQKFWCEKHIFVTTKDVFFATKMILVAVHTNDTAQAHSVTQVCAGIRRNQFLFKTGYSPLLPKWSQHIIKTHKYIYMLASEWIVTIWTEWGPECLCRINAQGS